MAPETAPGIDLQNLSSNWRKLQKQLQQDDASVTKKRNLNAGTLRLQTNGAKRLKTHASRQSLPGRTQKVHAQRMNGTAKYSRAQIQHPSATLALWAAENNIPAKDLAAAYGTSLHSTTLATAGGTGENINGGLSSTVEAGKYIAIDCEMVGVGPDPDRESALARVSLVNYHGHQLYDSFVQTKEAVTDFRTKVSGITPELLEQARSLEEVQANVAHLLDGKILIGHAVQNDLDALLLSHPKRDRRDTSKLPVFRQLANGRTPGLKKLAKEVLGVEIQRGEHSSIEDARAAMLLFRKEKDAFEKEHVVRWGVDRKVGPGAGADDKKAKKKKKRSKGKK